MSSEELPPHEDNETVVEPTIESDSEVVATESLVEAETLELVVAPRRNYIRGAGTNEESIPAGKVFAATPVEVAALGIHCRPATEAEVEAFHRTRGFVSVPLTSAAAIAAFDHDGDGRPGGSRKGRRNRRHQQAD